MPVHRKCSITNTPARPHTNTLTRTHTHTHTPASLSHNPMGPQSLSERVSLTRASDSSRDLPTNPTHTYTRTHTQLRKYRGPQVRQVLWQPHRVVAMDVQVSVCVCVRVCVCVLWINASRIMEHPNCIIRVNVSIRHTHAARLHVML